MIAGLRITAAQSFVFVLVEVDFDKSFAKLKKEGFLIFPLLVGQFRFLFLNGENIRTNGMRCMFSKTTTYLAYNTQKNLARKYLVFIKSDILCIFLKI